MNIIIMNITLLLCNRSHTWGKYLGEVAAALKHYVLALSHHDEAVAREVNCGGDGGYEGQVEDCYLGAQRFADAGHGGAAA